MTYPTQHLNIFGVCSQCWFCAVRFYMVALKMFCCTTFFTLPSLFNNVINYLSNRVRSFARSPIPLMMVRTTHFFTPRFSHAGYRAILVSSSSSFAYLKQSFALLTHALYKSFLFAGFYFLRTFFRASVCNTSHVCVRAGKLNPTSTTYKYKVPPALNFSLEFSHG